MKKISLFIVLIWLQNCIYTADAGHFEAAYHLNGAGALDEDSQLAQAIQMSLNATKIDPNDAALKKAQSESLRLQEEQRKLNAWMDASLNLHNKQLIKQLMPTTNANSDKSVSNLGPLGEARLRVVQEYRKLALSFLDAAETDNVPVMQEILKLDIVKNEVNRIPFEDDMLANFLIHSVVEAGNIKALKLLLSIADINVRHIDSGLTSLHMAVNAENGKLIKFLLDNKADATIKDRSGLSSLDYAIKLGKPVILRLFQNSGIDYAKMALDPNVLFSNVKDGNIAVVKELLKAKANPNLGIAGSALSVAVKDNNEELVKLLLSHKADPNKKDANAMSATEYAASKKNAELLELLEENDGTYASCSVCYEYLPESLKRFRCDHTFHAACLNQWKSKCDADSLLPEDKRKGLKYCCPYCKQQPL